jgi:hypothetical protein
VVLLKHNLMGIGGSRTYIRIVSVSPFRHLRNGLSLLPAHAEAVSLLGISVHILVEKFSVLRLEIQYWMLLAAVIVAAAITIGMRK